ncbi:MAG: cell division protein FtsZ [Flavobacteriales bacterium CG18_big_fil_WC_8_21_14_2_50_32_9]|nr:MAG: cell division protein FtsZ [Flavobacteriales bacterium CG18_big_fil_WC_8_21_14_2_50_32_9]PJC62679.1 MAG: cell division protein FtsZ [Flavobacteriales bacterium CG_4_9_14_0_2_um_filter_32_27]
MKFNLPKDQASIIKVIGVGGGGGNAVNHMYNQGITGVDFVICNTDAQVLESSPIPNKIQLGTTLTQGLGAGAKPEVGRNAAIEDIDTIKSILEINTKMVFITAGMGGGTGTGAAPIIAKTAREMGILTVGIVTIPFSFEGRKRKQLAEEGIEELRQNVDTLLVIDNDKLRILHGNLKMSECFSKADDILTVAAKGIAEIITVVGYINVDFEDVKTVMKDGGTAIMGSASAEGENRAIEAVTNAISSPLLNDNEIEGANYILLNITSGDEEVTMDEIDEITEYVQKEAGNTANLIFGNGYDESLGNKVSVTVIATGFGKKNLNNVGVIQEPTKIKHNLEDEQPILSTENTNEPTNTDFVDEVESPYLKTTQPVLDFDTPSNEEESTQKIAFNLDDDEETISEKRNSFSENEVTNENTTDNTSSETTHEYNETEDEEKTIFWNLNDEVENYDTSNEGGTSNSSKQGENKIEAETEEKSAMIYSPKIPTEDQLRRNNERILKIRELGMKMKTPSGIADLEKEPAYKRRNINLSEPPHSSESNVSRFSLNDDEDGKPKLKDGNSFLHDNVD